MRLIIDCYECCEDFPEAKAVTVSVCDLRWSKERNLSSQHEQQPKLENGPIKIVWTYIQHFRTIFKFLHVIF